jgi:hypothetical protein
MESMEWNFRTFSITSGVCAAKSRKACLSRVTHCASTYVSDSKPPPIRPLPLRDPPNGCGKNTPERCTPSPGDTLLVSAPRQCTLHVLGMWPTGTCAVNSCTRSS